MSTSTTFRMIEVGDYFSIPGHPGVLCEKVAYSRSGGETSNYRILKHPDKKKVNTTDCAASDLSVTREHKDKHLRFFSELDINKRAAFRGEPSTIIKKIRLKRLRKGGKVVNAFVVSTGVVQTRLAEYLRSGTGSYIFIRPDTKLIT